MIVVYAGLQRVASRAAAATLPQLVVAAVVGGRRGGALQFLRWESQVNRSQSADKEEDGKSV